MDYLSDDVIELTWYPDKLLMCFDVQLVDDDVYEADEQISIVLDSLDDSVSVISPSANITITDNDGRWSFKYR